MTRVASSFVQPFRRARLLTCIVSIAIACILLGTPPAWADVRSSDRISGATVQERGFSSALCPSIDANHALLVDDSGKVYFERDADTGAQIASITKVMTAIVALDYDPSLESRITVTEEAAAIGESSATLLEGDELDMRNALTAMMVASGNDAAESIAASLGAQMLADEGHPGAPSDQCVERFVRAMNDKASELGLKDTLFTNPHGLDDGEFAGDLHSTASDVAIEVAYAMKNDTFRSIVGSESATVEVRRDGGTAEIDLTSTDELLGVYEGTVGVKTGTTDLAGACFAGANDHDGAEYYAIVLDSSDEYQRFVDVQTLWDWCYGHETDYKLANAADSMDTTIGGRQASYPIMAYVAHTDWMDRSIPATIADPDLSVRVFGLDGNVSQEVQFDTVTGNVRAGDKVGTLAFKQRNDVIATVELVAAEDSPAPDALSGIGIWWQRLWGNSQTAENVLVNATPILIDKTQTVANANS